jgi:hypothetical protein
MAEFTVSGKDGSIIIFQIPEEQPTESEWVNLHKAVAKILTKANLNQIIEDEAEGA